MALTKCIRALKYRNSNIILINITNCSTKQLCEEAIIPDKNFQQKLLKVAVIGTPNSGKSTFINYLMDRKVNSAELSYRIIAKLTTFRYAQLLQKYTQLDKRHERYSQKTIPK